MAGPLLKMGRCYRRPLAASVTARCAGSGAVCGCAPMTNGLASLDDGRRCAGRTTADDAGARPVRHVFIE